MLILTPEMPAIHLDIAEVYRCKVEHLCDGLNRADCRAEAAEILRGLIQEIRLVPEDDEPENRAPWRARRHSGAGK